MASKGECMYLSVLCCAGITASDQTRGGKKVQVEGLSYGADGLFPACLRHGVNI